MPLPYRRIKNMSTKFEQLLDLLINEEHDKAQELFHEIVVEKSREIYENLISEEEDEEMDEAADDEEMDESADDEELDESAEDEEMDESAEEEMDESEEDLEDSYMMDSDDEIGGDATDDLGAEVGAGDMGDDGAEGGSEEQAIFDIKNAIEELEAAFAELEQSKGMGGEEPGFGDEEGGEEDDELMMGLGEGRKLREYTEKVGNDWDKSGSQKTAGPVGSGTGDKAGQTSVSNTKSPVSSGKGKPTTGATAGNILGDSATGKGKNTGDRPDSLNKGIAQVSGEKFATGLHNVDGKKSGVKTLSKQGSGYPGNNKNAGPVGSGSGDKAGQTSIHNAPSPLNGAPNRNA
jgi:hypothetical protein